MTTPINEMNLLKHFDPNNFTCDFIFGELKETIPLIGLVSWEKFRLVDHLRPCRNI